MDEILLLGFGIDCEDLCMCLRFWCFYVVYVVCFCVDWSERVNLLDGCISVWISGWLDSMDDLIWLIDEWIGGWISVWMFGWLDSMNGGWMYSIIIGICGF